MKRIIVLIIAVIIGVFAVVVHGAESEGSAIPAQGAVITDDVPAQGAVITDDVPAVTTAPPEAVALTLPASLLPMVSFSHDETFYEYDIFVELTHENPDAKIYYTLNGAHPYENARTCNPDGFPADSVLFCHHIRDRCAFEDGLTIPAAADGSDPFCHLAGANLSRRNPAAPPPPELYTEPIHIEAGERVTATTVKAVAIIECDDTGTYEVSPVVTKSYITGITVWERFSPETFIFVLSADPYDLNCYYHGIAIEGVRREQYLLHRTSRGNIDPPDCANFNSRGRPSERDFFVETFDFEGNLLIHQAAGGRIQGGWSRATDQKSWRLIARKEYSKGKFSHAFFNDSYNANNQLTSRFDRLILRNGGNDRQDANLRDELGAALAKQAGFPDVASFAPAAVFLNSRYYGFAWLKESLCEGYLVQKYGGEKEKYEIIRKTERGRNGNERATDDWQEIFALAEAAVKEVGDGTGDGFNDDAIFEQFTSRVDMDNFMLYFAIQTYIDNKDWPGNNMKMWRYFPDEDEVLLTPFNDGKWRFILYDVEFAMGIYWQGFTADNLRTILGGRGHHMGGPSILLQAVLQREDMQERYVNTVCDLISGAFSAANINAVMYEIGNIGNHEQFAALRERTVGWFNFMDGRDNVSQFARGRPTIFYAHMMSAFGIPDNMYTVSLTGAEGAEAWLNTRRVFGSDDNARSVYFTEYDIPLKAVLSAGYEFVSWEINGVHYYDGEMTITPAMADSGSYISITLHTNRTIDGAPLLITAVNSGSGADWVELFNPNAVPISTRDYFLSDRGENLRRWKIPSITVHPGETLIVVMSNNRTSDALMKPQANFSLSTGETLFLSDTNDEIHAMLSIPSMSRGETLRRMEDGTYQIIADNI
jgi:hypothetical protein